MNGEMTFWVIIGVAITTAAIHTLAGPDHYLPFIALARARHWTLRRTLTLTFISGIGHLASAILLAMLFNFFSELFTRWHGEWLESVRGSMAAWMLAILGTVYALWGIRHALRKHPHTHVHQHADGTSHVHEHEHTSLNEHAHPHVEGKNLLLGWSLFIIFVLGPCEAMLPILISATAVGRTCLFLATILFSITTLLTMLITVTVGFYGARALAFHGAERWSHLAAGAVLAFCGFGMIFLGL